MYGGLLTASTDDWMWGGFANRQEFDSTMKHRQLSDALDECLTRLAEDNTSVEACLARYPERAAELRPLLEMALEMQSLPRPQACQAAVEAGRRRMMAAVHQRVETHRVREPAGLLVRVETWIAGAFEGLRRPAASKRSLGWSAALATVAALLIVVIAGGLLLPPWLGTRVERTAQLESLQRGVLVRADEGADWVPASSGATLRPGDQVRTDSEGVALLTFFDGSTTALEGGTQLTLVELSSRRDGTAKAIVLHQQRGQTQHAVEPLRSTDARFQVRTPAGVATVRGTRFEVVVDDDGRTTVVQISGLVTFTFDDIEVELEPGWARTISPDGSLSEPILVPTPREGEDFVRWPTGEPSDTPAPTTTETSPPPSPTATATAQPTVTADGGGEAGGSEDQATDSPTRTPVPPTATPTQTPTPTQTATPSTPQPPGLKDNPTPEPPTETPVPPTETPTPTAPQPPDPATPTAPQPPGPKTP